MKSFIHTSTGNDSGELKVMETKTLSDNELIAEFMGHQPEVSRLHPLDFNYDSSWDSLMPVVEKMRTLWKLTQDSQAAGLMNAMFCADIKAAHQIVVEFIKWYNSQTKTV